MPERQYDAVVIGGGFFGCSVALHLRGYVEKVLVLEKEAELLQRASYVNQARVHAGYHYPRSILTALRSRMNFPRFIEQYRECVDETTDHYYAVCKGAAMSKVTAAQYRAFCDRIGAPIEPAPLEVRHLFNDEMIDDVFIVKEQVFDAARLRARMATDLGARGVEVRYGADVIKVRASDERGMQVAVRNGDGVESCTARYVFNCAYSQVNRVLAAAGLPALPLKHELAEIALVEVPERLRGLAITIMDGPFLSTMPFPPRGVHSLTHVRYTPHCAWKDNGTSHVDPDRLLRAGRLRTSYIHMIKDAQRFLPCMEDCRYVDSMWEIKTVLPQSEIDDSRPILFVRSGDQGNLVSVMGAKLDNVYDVLVEIDHMFS